MQRIQPSARLLVCFSKSKPAKRDGKSFWYNLIEKPLNHRLKKERLLKALPGCSVSAQ
jgi:hypothetical protein